jgi:hypothetical protein
MSEPLPRDLFPDAPPANATVPPAPVRLVNGSITDVRVIDFDMLFTSMVGFIIKWTLATIPAAIIFGLLALLLYGLASTLMSGILP